MTIILIPKEVDRIFYSVLHRICPSLPDRNKKIIIDSLRGNYQTNGFIYKKIKNNIDITLVDLYSSYIAHNRHTRTEYNKDIYNVRKKFNNHDSARNIFGSYMDAIFQESKTTIKTRKFDKTEEDYWLKAFNIPE